MTAQVFLEIFGYVASVIVAISLMMSSILKLRWINLVGAALFSTYGFIIGALPVGFLNLFIALIDVYYLQKMYAKSEYFKLLEVPKDSKYLIEFLEFYDKEIQIFFPGFKYAQNRNSICILILRNMAVAGVFLAHENDAETLHIGLDFVIPEYRDFKLGRFIYIRKAKYFYCKGYKTICAIPQSSTHSKYLAKMGFNTSDIKDDKGNSMMVLKLK